MAGAEAGASALRCARPSLATLRTRSLATTLACELAVGLAVLSAEQFAATDLAEDLTGVALTLDLATALARDLTGSDALNLRLEVVSSSRELVGEFRVDLAAQPDRRQSVVLRRVVGDRVLGHGPTALQ